MQTIFENNYFNAVGYSGEIDTLGPFEAAPASNKSQGAGTYTYVRVIENSEATTINRLDTYSNCHPDMVRMGHVDFVVLENKAYKNETNQMLLASSSGKIRSSDLDAFYNAMEQSRSIVKLTAKAGYWRAIYYFIVSIPLMLTVIGGLVMLVGSIYTAVSTWRTKSKQMSSINGAPKRAELEPIIRAFLDKAAANRAPKTAPIVVPA